MTNTPFPKHSSSAFNIFITRPGGKRLSLGVASRVDFLALKKATQEQNILVEVGPDIKYADRKEYLQAAKYAQDWFRNLKESSKIVKEQKIKLSAKRTPNRELQIEDHTRVNIIISPSTSKIFVFPKGEIEEDIYPVQKRLYKYLMDKGAIIYGTEAASTVFNGYEAKYPAPADKDMVMILCQFIYEWLQEEKKIYERLDKQKENIERYLTEPDENHSTEADEFPQEELKGSKNKNPYMNYIGSWLGWKGF